MRILLINVPHPPIGSRMPDDHLPPLGLLAIGGPLIDAGNQVQLIDYDPDQIQALYVTPHRWTPFFRIAKDRTVIQTDRRRRDYKHQVLSSKHMPPWRLILCVKAIEAAVQLRPKALLRTFLQKDRRLRHAMRWYTQIGRRVWLYELRNFFLRDRRLSNGPKLRRRAAQGEALSQVSSRA